MATTKRQWIWVISTLSLIFLLGYLTGTKWSCNGKRPPTTLYDTLYFSNPTYEIKEVFIHDTIKHYIPVNAHPTVDYKDTPDEPNYVVEIVRDTVVIKDNRDSSIVAAYNRRFLTTYLPNPKLLRSRFSKNHIAHDFLMPNGNRRTQNYPVDLEHYNYTWEMGDMKAVPIPYTPIKPKWTFDSYTTMTYDPFQKSGRLQVDGTISKGKFGVTAAGVLNGFAPHGELRLGIRFKNTK
jgi:hypothetical protein